MTGFPFRRSALRMRTRTRPERVARWLALAVPVLAVGVLVLGGWVATAALWRAWSHGATFARVQAALGGLGLLGALGFSALARLLAPRSEPETSAPEDASPRPGGEVG